jgi:hypothetical protein
MRVDEREEDSKDFFTDYCGLLGSTVDVCRRM